MEIYDTDLQAVWRGAAFSEGKSGQQDGGEGGLDIYPVGFEFKTLPPAEREWFPFSREQRGDFDAYYSSLRSFYRSNR